MENFTQEQIKDQTRQFVDESIPMLIDNNLVKKISGFDIEFERTEDFFTSPKSFKNLFNMKMNIGAQNDIMKNIKSQVSSILEILEKELWLSSSDKYVVH